MKKYFFRWGALFVLIMTLLLSVTIIILGRGAVRDVIRTNLAHELSYIEKCILRDKDFITDDGILYILYDKDHNVRMTNASQDISNSVSTILLSEKGRLHGSSNVSTFHKINGSLCCMRYLRSPRLAGKFGHGSVLVALLPVNLMENEYFTFALWIIIGVIIVSLIMFTMLNFWSRRYEGLIDNIIIGAEKIGNSNDFSDRLDNKVEYPELIALTNAHNRLLDRVEDLIKQQKEFGRNLSHELKTPIGIISAQCQLLKEDNYDTKKLPEYISRIERQNNHMMDLSSQLLILSKLEDRSQKEQIEQISLNEVIEFLCSDIEESHNLSNIFACKLEPITVEANMSYLVILIENLLTNAMKYGMSDQPIEITLTHESDLVVLTVTDHGGGIPAKSENKLFEAYYRSEESDEIEGFGLGLTLAKKIAMHYGGDVEVESKLGAGSTFVARLHLPLI